jgi:DNA-binding response OmpR family regulator
MRTLEHFSCGCADSPVSVLIVTAKDRERVALQAISAGAQWSFHEAQTIVDAVKKTSDSEIGTIITDGDLPDGTWMDLLESLRSRRNPPRIIVFSPLADDRFWAEVLNAGGYDVLATPFEPKEVIRATHVAWLSWRRTARVTTATNTLTNDPASRWKGVFSAAGGR